MVTKFEDCLQDLILPYLSRKTFIENGFKSFKKKKKMHQNY